MILDLRVELEVKVLFCNYKDDNCIMASVLDSNLVVYILIIYWRISPKESKIRDFIKLSYRFNLINLLPD